MFKKIVVFALLFIIDFSYAQDFDTVIKKYKEALINNNKYKADIQISLYKNNESYKYETYSGFMVKNDSIVYQTLDAMEMLSHKDYFIKLNHGEKAIQIVRMEKKQGSLLNFKTFEIKELLLYYDKDKFYKKNNQYVISLKSKSISFSPINKIEIHINKDDYRLIKGVIYYSNIYDFSIFSKSEKEKNLGNARFEFTISNYENLNTNNLKYLNLNRYFKKEDNKIILAQKYKEFELIK